MKNGSKRKKQKKQQIKNNCKTYKMVLLLFAFWNIIISKGVIDNVGIHDS